MDTFKNGFMVDNTEMQVAYKENKKFITFIASFLVGEYIAMLKR